MTDLHFRAATLADLDAIVDLVTSAYRGDSSRAGWTTEADFLDGNRIDAEVLRADIERPQEPRVARGTRRAVAGLRSRQ
jgi:dihydroxyacetone kinase